MKITLIVPILLTLVCGHAQNTITINDSVALTKTLVHEEGFKNGMENWTVEQAEGGTVMAKNGNMEITDVSGCTVWFNKKLNAPLLIEYDAVVVDDGGPQDRVSDLNCFWLATDPDNPKDFFTTSKGRKGKFKNYDGLQLYYVGLGGHHNTKTRYRRYTGTGDKPLLAEHDLSDPEYLILPNTVNHIKIVVFHNSVQYYRNDKLIFDFYDTAPYNSGYFGIRTVNNHMSVDNFKVFSLKAFAK